MILLSILLLQAGEPSGSGDRVASGLFLLAATALGAIGKTAIDFLIGYRMNSAKIIQTAVDTRKTENDIIGDLQTRLMDSQKVLLEMQEHLDKWIKRFEQTSEEASEVEDELRSIRRDFQECIDGRKDCIDLCSRAIKFFDRTEPLIIGFGTVSITEPLLQELSNLRREMIQLRKEFETDFKVLN